MRYYNGIVEDVSDKFIWHRNVPNQGPGSIIFQDYAGHETEATIYKTATVFSFHPPTPFAMVNVDASVHTTYTKQSIPDDERPYPVWEPLQFFHPKGQLKGLSQAVFSSSLGMDVAGGSPVNYVAGQNDSWIPNLIPSTHRYPYRYPPRSRGLGGDLTILLGLMAFSPERNPFQLTVEPALRDQWKGKRWESTGPPRGCKCLLVQQ